MTRVLPCEWQEAGIRYVSEKSLRAVREPGKGPSYYACTLQFTASIRRARRP